MGKNSSFICSQMDDAYIYDTFQDKWVQQNIYNDGAGYTATVTFDANGGTGSVPADVVVDFLGIAMGFVSSGNTAIAPFYFQLGSEQPTYPAGTFLGRTPNHRRLGYRRFCLAENHRKGA